ncbi:MAG: hypothetical protein K2P95_04805, partial [Hyphomonadaceae bacterium]|nr:hypothetical protein [Hyphomonadaceae bacterium]
PRAAEPPAYRPRAEEPPAYRPHAEEPPAYRPHAEEPPAYRPRAEEPPAYRPQAEEPSAVVNPDVARRRARESAKLREDVASTRPPWSQPERSPEEEPRHLAPAPTPKRRRNSNLQGLIIGVAIGVVLAAAAFFLLQGGGGTPAPQPAAVQWPQSEEQAPPSEPVAGETEAPPAVEEAPIEPAPQQPRVSAPRPGDEAYRPPSVRSPPVQQGARPQSSVFSYGRPVDPATGGEGASTPAPPPSETN